MSRTRLLLIACALAGSLAGGCRCNNETLAPVDFETGSDRAPVDPSSVLAPPWQPPLIAQLDNGAMLHWLRERDNPAFHVRVLLPTSIDADKLSAAAAASVMQAIELRLGARVRRIPDARLDIGSRPGRIELALHGRDADAEALLEALAETLADAGDPKLLTVAQGKVLARHREADASTLATAGLIAELLGHPLNHEYASKQDLVDLTKNRLERAWSMLVDPRDALIIVHSGRDPEDETVSAAVARLGTRWKGGLGSGKPSVTVRLRAEPPKKLPDTFVLTETRPASMRVFTGEPDRGGRAVVMIGRIIPTPTIEERALARISQRLMQEQLDARLLVAGPISVLAVRVRVSASDPILSIQRVVDRMRAFGAEAQPGNRIDQAANLWLGARVVEASLTGEDWTSLWSESIDLAGSDREIFVALARDAQTMLELDPERVREYMARWFDPQAGEPGWVMVGAGIDDDFRAKLAARIQLR
ncbi:MAG TPA: hypothetical protein VK034_25345 [Enhygromyxa sp.]|nr:hypothetical protein [Enhygromyxa sp.]